MYFLALSTGKTKKQYPTESNGSQLWFWIFPHERNQGHLEKWVIPDLGLEMHRMILEYLITPDTKAAIKDYKGQVKRTQELTWGSSHSKWWDTEYPKKSDCN